MITTNTITPLTATTGSSHDMESMISGVGSVVQGASSVESTLHVESNKMCTVTLHEEIVATGHTH